MQVFASPFNSTLPGGYDMSGGGEEKMEWAAYGGNMPSSNEGATFAIQGGCGVSVHFTTP